MDSHKFAGFGRGTQSDPRPLFPLAKMGGRGGGGMQAGMENTRSDAFPIGFERKWPWASARGCGFTPLLLLQQQPLTAGGMW